MFLRGTLMTTKWALRLCLHMIVSGGAMVVYYTAMRKTIAIAPWQLVPIVLASWAAYAIQRFSSNTRVTRERALVAAAAGIALGAIAWGLRLLQQELFGYWIGVLGFFVFSFAALGWFMAETQALRIPGHD